MATNLNLATTPDTLVAGDDWSDLRQYLELPEIDMDGLLDYRIGRLREQMRLAGVDVHVMVNPTSLRYAVDYSNYALYQSRIPTTYLLVSTDGPTVLYGGYAEGRLIDRTEPADHIAFFDLPSILQGPLRRC